MAGLLAVLGQNMPCQTSSFMMSLLVMSFGDRFCFSRKGGRDGGGEWVHPTARLPLGLAVGSPWSALGGPLISLFFAQMGLENSLLATYGLHFGQ